MKVALLSESPADEAVLRVLVEAVLGAPPKFVAPGLRARGWPNVAQVLPAVIHHLHFNTDTDALVVSCDSDDTVVHTAAHNAPGYYHPHCRMCQLRGIFHRTTKKFPAARGRSRVLRGVGVAVPALEAWLLCGRDPQVSEARWIAGQEQRAQPYSRAELKWRCARSTATKGRAWRTRSAVRYTSWSATAGIRAGWRMIFPDLRN